jgi:hypothetical protein
MDLDAMAEAIGCTVNDARALRRYIERGTLRKAHELAHKLGVYLDFTLVPRHASERYLRHVRETAGEAVTRDVPA